MRTPQLPVVDWTDAPADLNGLVRFTERRNRVPARVPSHFKRSLQTTEVHHVNVRHLQINPKRSSLVKRSFSVIPTFPYEKHILLFGMQQFAVVKAGHRYLNGNHKARSALMHTASVDDVLWRLAEMRATSLTLSKFGKTPITKWRTIGA